MCRRVSKFAMSLRNWLLLSVCLVVYGLSVSRAVAAEPLRVMTFNVRVPVDQDANAWVKRRDLLVQVVKTQHPDVLGTQELTEEQGEYIAAHLPGYAWFGQGRDGGTKGEHMGVFYRTDRLTVLQSGDFWLSDTPDVPGSKTWGQPYPRMVTWAQFQRRGHVGDNFYYFNTHFPYREQDTEARLRSAQEIIQRLGQLPASAKVVLTGDFNCAPDTPVHAALTGELNDMWLHATTRVGPAETFHNFTGHADQRIDWILARGFHASAARTVTTHVGARYPSDHFPVVVELVPVGTAMTKSRGTP